MRHQIQSSGASGSRGNKQAVGLAPGHFSEVQMSTLPCALQCRWPSSTSAWNHCTLAESPVHKLFKLGDVGSNLVDSQFAARQSQFCGDLSPRSSVLLLADSATARTQLGSIDPALNIIPCNLGKFLHSPVLRIRYRLHGPWQRSKHCLLRPSHTVSVPLGLNPAPSAHTVPFQIQTRFPANSFLVWFSSSRMTGEWNSIRAHSCPSCTEKPFGERVRACATSHCPWAGS